MNYMKEKYDVFSLDTIYAHYVNENFETTKNEIENIKSNEKRQMKSKKYIFTKIKNGFLFQFFSHTFSLLSLCLSISQSVTLIDGYLIPTPNILSIYIYSTKVYISFSE